MSATDAFQFHNFFFQLSQESVTVLKNRDFLFLVSRCSVTFTEISSPFNKTRLREILSYKLLMEEQKFDLHFWYLTSGVTIEGNLFRFVLS